MQVFFEGRADYAAPMRIDLTGKHALVTGGSRGIGAASALLLANAGADLSLIYHNHHEAAGRVVEEIRRTGVQAVAVAADLSTSEGAGNAVERAEAALGPIQIAVCNAGIWKRAPLDEMTEQQWQETIDANLKSVFLTCRAVVLSMKPRGQGNLILISSTAAQRGEAEYSHYAASKGGVVALTKSLASELGPFGIRVNAVAPGWVETDMTRAVFADREQRKAILDSTPLQRIAQPEDIAGPVLFLASSLACHVQGEILNVNGGSVMCG